MSRSKSAATHAEAIYGSLTTFRPGESISLLAYPAIAFPVSILFDEEDHEPAGAEG